VDNPVDSFTTLFYRTSDTGQIRKNDVNSFIFQSIGATIHLLGKEKQFAGKTPPSPGVNKTGVKMFQSALLILYGDCR